MNAWRAKKNKGFTLIELLVVISIIALLSSIVLAATNTARAKGRDAVRYSDIRQINIAIQLYENDHNNTAPLASTATPSSPVGYADWIGNWGDLATALKPYIAKLPVDPCGNSCPNQPTGGWYYSYEYSVNSKGDYKIYIDRLETKSGPYGFNFTSGALISSQF